MLENVVYPLVRALHSDNGLVQGEARIAAIAGCTCVQDAPCSLVTQGVCGAAEGFAVVRMRFTPRPEPLRFRKPVAHELDIFVPCGFELQALGDLRRENAPLHLRLPRRALLDGECDLTDLVELSGTQGVIFEQGLGRATPQ